MIRCCRRIAAALVLALTPLTAYADDAPRSSQSKSPSESPSKPAPSELDKQLLEGLGGDLLEGLPPLKPPPPEKSPPPPEETSPPPGETPSQRGDAAPTGEGELRQKPGPADELDGEDVDLAGQAANPVIDLGRRMKTIERLISERNTSAATQRMQEQIVADMSRLIDQIRQQKKKGGGGPRRPRRPAGQTAGEPGDQESSNPAEESQSRVRSADDRKAEVRDLENLLKEVWGHLPERVRQQMLSGSAEEVLPKYQKLIEEYYKRLAEDAAKNP